ncbi:MULTISPECIES: subtilase-type protease inhibitor [Streptomyces]|uniref:Probable subtilase-type protease inhibitor n=1 Tax=Streptomyces sudanensis TaxID=436397 RepID=A0ABY4T9T8_9ACTN|nr:MULTISPECIES: subtilase-type protease inhibitor [Streptomyces]MCP9985492.1 subtilase-type protease inhibitor [Streptomyces sudanensis]URN14708.1 subtilase-type protease inhibitor [Streptomyces sudanensis]
MSHKRTSVRRTAVLGMITAAAMTALAPAATAAPERASTGASRLYAPNALVLTVAEGEKARTATPLRAVTLTCAPTPGGTHPAPEEACGELHAANGDFSVLRGEEGRACVKIYDPLVVTAEGVWEGKRVRYERTFGNSCLLQAEGGSVFSF